MFDSISTEQTYSVPPPAMTEAARLAEEARKGLLMVAQGEDRTIDGWLVYGAALNEGRKLHDGDLEFGRWVRTANLAEGVHDHDRAAAMWAAADRDTFEATREANPRVRTVRGLHAKWKEAQRPEPKAKPVYEEPTEAERETVRKLKAILNDPNADENFRASVQRKLETYEARFGPEGVKPETPKQLTTKQELADEITRVALKKALKNEKAFNTISFAINHLYGSVEQMQRVLRTMSSL